MAYKNELDRVFYKLEPQANRLCSFQDGKAVVSLSCVTPSWGGAGVHKSSSAGLLSTLGSGVLPRGLACNLEKVNTRELPGTPSSLVLLRLFE